MIEAKKSDDPYDIDNDDYWNDESNFTPFIRGNPFKDRLNDGYSIVINVPPGSKRELYTYEEIIDDEIDRFKFVILDKIKDLPREQVDGRLNEIFETLKGC